MFPRKDPGKGPEKIPTWTCEKLADTGPISGWLAGPIEWVETHHYHRTIPCFHIISDGRLDCPYCPKSPRVSWSGYVPIYTGTGQPIVVVITESSRDVTTKLNTFDPIIARKGKGKTGIVTVGAALAKTEKYRSTLAARQDPADIRMWLLKLWKEPKLMSLFSASPAVSDKTMSLVEQPAATDDVPPELAARVEAARRAKKVNEIVLGEVDALFLPDGTPIRLPKPDRQRNGKHPE